MPTTEVVSKAMIKCIEKQLVDFLPGGKFHASDLPPSRQAQFAPVTNLSCEHHFGDLDSSHRRRPHASYHHHSSVQMLKRNRTQIASWIKGMGEKERNYLLMKARLESTALRDSHRANEREVLKRIHSNMTDEQSLKGNKRKVQR
ncbi:hypothetical protein DPMN_098020 [Dreissena polymorpha]|uniref:Uncharacterized protein n=1 Tax=Dreissena polymorpha TaxID=45954 RepID=A0A9D4LCV1_DREPO|nr:hypothetical protein DPMN_098020 [Dreissena polymorpha]